MPSDERTQLQTDAAAPKKASGDQGSMEVHALKDQIEVDQYVESTNATRRSGSIGIRFLQYSPGGAR